jgi:hypothetical protein
VNTKATYLFLITLAGDSNDHIQNFERLETLVAANPGAIIFKLVGSGGITAGAALTYLDIAAKLPENVERAVISYSSMTAWDFALWLGIAPLRDMRPSAWVWVADPKELEINKLLGPDEQRCFDIIGHHTPFELVKNRIVSVTELRNLLLIDTPFSESLDSYLVTETKGGMTR